MDQSHRFIRFHQDAGAIRTEQFKGKDHMVVPTIGLVEGVLHAANAENPELSLAQEFGKFGGANWNGRPVTLGHPYINGQFVSASGNPSIFEDEAVGFIFNANVDESKLKMELFLDLERIPKGEVERIQSGKTIEVSTGFFTEVEASQGEFEGRAFSGVQKNISPDHIAILAEGDIGACSVEDGCGLPRLNTLKVNKKGKVVLEKNCSCGCGGNCGGSKVNEVTLNSDLAQNLLDITKSVSNIVKESPGILARLLDSGAQKTKTKENVVGKNELIEKIVANESLGFGNDDIENLSKFDEKQLEALVNAEVKAFEIGEVEITLDANKVDEKSNHTLADYVKDETVPVEVRDLISRSLAKEKAEKDTLVTSLKSCESLKMSDEQLNAKSIEELEVLTSFVKDMEDKAAIADYSPMGARVNSKDSSIGAPLRTFDFKGDK